MRPWSNIQKTRRCRLKKLPRAAAWNDLRMLDSAIHGAFSNGLAQFKPPPLPTEVDIKVPGMMEKTHEPHEAEALHEQVRAV